MPYTNDELDAIFAAETTEESYTDEELDAIFAAETEEEPAEEQQPLLPESRFMPDTETAEPSSLSVPSTTQVATEDPTELKVSPQMGEKGKIAERAEPLEESEYDFVDQLLASAYKTGKAVVDLPKQAQPSLKESGEYLEEQPDFPQSERYAFNPEMFLGKGGYASRAKIKEVAKTYQLPQEAHPDNDYEPMNVSKLNAWAIQHNLNKDANAKKMSEKERRDAGLRTYSEQVAEELYPLDAQISELKKSSKALYTQAPAIKHPNIGNINYKADIMLGEALTGSDADIDKAMKAVEEIKRDIAKNAGEKGNFFEETGKGLGQMSMPLLKAVAKSTIPIIGKVWSWRDWATQGTGEVFYDLEKAGISRSLSKKIAPMAGMIYAGIEYFQLKQITRFKGMGNVKKLFLTKLIDAIKQSGEEAAQKVVTEGTVEIGKEMARLPVMGEEAAHQVAAKDGEIRGSTDRSLGETLIKLGLVAGEEFIGTLPEMSVLSLFGLAAGGMQIAREKQTKHKNVLSKVTAQAEEKLAKDDQLRAELEAKVAAEPEDQFAQLEELTTEKETTAEKETAETETTEQKTEQKLSDEEADAELDRTIEEELKKEGETTQEEAETTKEGEIQQEGEALKPHRLTQKLSEGEVSRISGLTPDQLRSELETQHPDTEWNQETTEDMMDAYADKLGIPKEKKQLTVAEKRKLQGTEKEQQTVIDEITVPDNAQTGQETVQALKEKAAEMKKKGLDPKELQKKYNSKDASMSLDKIRRELSKKEKYKGASKEEMDRAVETAATNWATGIKGKPYRLQFEKDHAKDDNSDNSDYVTWQLLGDLYKFKAVNDVVSHDQADTQVLRPVADIMTYYFDRINEIVKKDPRNTVQNTHDSGDEFSAGGRTRKEALPIIYDHITSMRDDINKLRITNKEKGIDVPVGFAAGMVEGINPKLAESLMEEAKKNGRSNEITLDKKLTKSYNIVSSRAPVDERDITDIYKEQGVFTGREEERRGTPKTKDHAGDGKRKEQRPVGKVTKDIRKTPAEWAAEADQVIVDFSGWGDKTPRGLSRASSKAPLTEAEYRKRVAASTVREKDTFEVKGEAPLLYTEAKPSETGILEWRNNDVFFTQKFKGKESLDRKKALAEEKKAAQKNLDRIKARYKDVTVPEAGFKDRELDQAEKILKWLTKEHKKIKAPAKKTQTKTREGAKQRFKENLELKNAEQRNAAKGAMGVLNKIANKPEETGLVLTDINYLIDGEYTEADFEKLQSNLKRGSLGETNGEIELTKKYLDEVGTRFFPDNTRRNAEQKLEETIEEIYYAKQQAEGDTPFRKGKAEKPRKLTPEKTEYIAEKFAESLNLIPKDADVRLRIVPMDSQYEGSMRENKDSSYDVNINQDLSKEKIASALNEEISHIGIRRVLASESKTRNRMERVFKAQYNTKAMNKLRDLYADEIGKKKTQAEKDDYLQNEFWAHATEDYLANKKTGAAKILDDILQKFLSAIGVKNSQVKDVTRQLVSEMKTTKTAKPGAAEFGRKAEVDEEFEKRRLEAAKKTLGAKTFNKVKKTIERNLRDKLKAQLKNKQQSVENFQKEMRDGLKEYGKTLPDNLRKDWNKWIRVIDLPKTSRGIKGKVGYLLRKMDNLEERKAHQNASNRLQKMVKSIPKKMRPEYQEQVDALLEGVDISRMTEKTRSKLKKLERLLESGLDLPKDLKENIQRLYKTPIADMSPSQIEGLELDLGRVIAQQTLKDQLLVNNKHRKAEELKLQAEDNIEKTSREEMPEARGSIPAKKPPKLPKKIWNAMVGLDAQTAETIAMNVDGMKYDEHGATTGKVIAQGASNALTTRLGHNQYVEDQFNKKFGDLDISKYSVIGNPKLLEGLRDVFETKEERIAETIELPDHGKIELTPAHKMAFYMHLQNEHNTEALLDNDIAFDTAVDDKGITLTENDLQAILDSVTDKEREIGEWMLDIADTHNQNALNEISNVLFGRNIAEEDRYMRLVRKNLYKDYITKNAMPQDVGAYITRFLEDAGALKERKKGAKGTVVIEDAFKAFWESTNLAGTYKGYAPWLRSAKQFLHDTEGQFRKYGRLDEHRALKQYVREIEGNAVEANRATDMEKLLKGWYGRAASAVLGLNPSVTAKQLASYPFALTELDAQDLATGLSVVPKSEEAKDTQRWLREFSPQMRARLDAGQVTMELGGRSAGNELNRFFGGKEPLMDKQTAGIKAFDTIVMIRLAKAAKDHLKRTTDLKGEDLNRAAAALQFKIVSRTQPMYSKEHRSAIGRSKNMFLRVMTPFTSVTNQMFNMVKRSHIEYTNSKKTANDKAKFAKDISAVWISSTVMMTAIDELRGWLFGHGPTYKSIIGKLIENTFAPIYFMRPIASLVGGMIKYSDEGYLPKYLEERATTNLLTGMGQDFFGGARQVYNTVKSQKEGGLTSKDVDKILEGTGQMLIATATATGIPARNIQTYLYKMPVALYERLVTNNTPLGQALKETGYHPQNSGYVNRRYAVEDPVTGKTRRYRRKFKMPRKVYDEYNEEVRKIAERKFRQSVYNRKKGDKKKNMVKEIYREARETAKSRIPTRDLKEIKK